MDSPAEPGTSAKRLPLKRNRPVKQALGDDDSSMDFPLISFAAPKKIKLTEHRKEKYKQQKDMLRGIGLVGDEDSLSKPISAPSKHANSNSRSARRSSKEDQENKPPTVFPDLNAAEEEPGSGSQDDDESRSSCNSSKSGRRVKSTPSKHTPVQAKRGRAPKSTETEKPVEKKKQDSTAKDEEKQKRKSAKRLTVESFLTPSKKKSAETPVTDPVTPTSHKVDGSETKEVEPAPAVAEKPEPVMVESVVTKPTVIEPVSGDAGSEVKAVESIVAEKEDGTTASTIQLSTENQAAQVIIMEPGVAENEETKQPQASSETTVDDENNKTPEKCGPPPMGSPRKLTPSILRKPNTPMSSDKKKRRVYFDGNDFMRRPSESADKVPSSPSTSNENQAIFPQLSGCTEPIQSIFSSIERGMSNGLSMKNSFHRLGIKTIGDLAMAPPSKVENIVAIRKPRAKTVHDALADYHQNRKMPKETDTPFFATPKQPSQLAGIPEIEKAVEEPVIRVEETSTHAGETAIPAEATKAAADEPGIAKEAEITTERAEENSAKTVDVEAMDTSVPIVAESTPIAHTSIPEEAQPLSENQGAAELAEAKLQSVPAQEPPQLAPDADIKHEPEDRAVCPEFAHYKLRRLSEVKTLFDEFQVRLLDKEQKKKAMCFFFTLDRHFHNLRWMGSELKHEPMPTTTQQGSTQACAPQDEAVRAKWSAMQMDDLSNATNFIAAFDHDQLSTEQRMTALSLARHLDQQVALLRHQLWAALHSA
ncbi:unnamed protein product, partial [Mesorhabditis spiculigera]